MFTKAIVKTPGRSIVKAITSADLGIPDYKNALHQHQRYIDALNSCGVEVIILDADENYPDSCFLEDTALITPKCCIITNPGAESRKGEISAIDLELNVRFSEIERIYPPGTVEAGDVMMVGNQFFIGLSQRTNHKGAEQLKNILEEYGHVVFMVDMKEVLHLKTGLSYLENNNLLVAGEFIDHPLFAEFNKIIVSEAEAYAANCIWVNGTVIVPQGFPGTRKKIEDLGYYTISVDVSEFQKIDGGLSCLSLRF